MGERLLLPGLPHSFVAPPRKFAIDPRGTLPAEGRARTSAAEMYRQLSLWDRNLENTRWPSNVLEKFKKIGISFHILVTLPVVISLLYFYVLASDVYVAESSFVVRNSDSPKITGLGAILGAGITAGNDENVYAAQTYMTSRDALSYLNSHNYIMKAYSRPDISIFDRFNPTGLNGTFENLYRYFIDKVQIEHDRSTAITTIRVRAFTPSDAQQINEKLVDQAEKVVNQLNERARADMIGLSRKEAQAAQQRLQQSSVALAAFRNRHGVIDPERQAAANIELISKLQGELVAARTQLSELRSIAPNNPQVKEIEYRIAALGQALREERGKLTGNANSLATRGIEYQRLQLANTLAEKEYAVALNALQEARNAADKKQSYIETLYRPNLPDEAAEPRKLRGMASVLLFSLVLWGLARVLVAGVREHQD